MPGQKASEESRRTQILWAAFDVRAAAHPVVLRLPGHEIRHDLIRARMQAELHRCRIASRPMAEEVLRAEPEQFAGFCANRPPQSPESRPLPGAYGLTSAFTASGRANVAAATLSNSMLVSVITTSPIAPFCVIRVGIFTPSKSL